MQFSLFHLVPARPEFYSVSQFPGTTLMVVGVNGQPGVIAHFLVDEECSLGDASAIIRLHRAVEEAALELPSNRKTATSTGVQVLFRLCPSSHDNPDITDINLYLNYTDSM